VIYQISEKFKSLQGEGVYAGTPMAFIRFVGCSVGKKICHACDTDFEQMHNWRGGGEFDQYQLLTWVDDYEHICLTGGEPLDQELDALIQQGQEDYVFHIETSGTKLFSFYHGVKDAPKHLWVCVSPKPGFLEEAVMAADEVKVIVPGLGSGPGWPTLQDALRWAQAGKTVFLQPRNGRFDVDSVNLKYVVDLLAQYPTLRLSVQMHKILKVQ
jgi:7-carboxy-7-deazaguanine synthase